MLVKFPFKHLKKQVLSLSFFMFSVANVHGQKAGNNGWFFLSNSHEISEKIDFLTDIQVRSADKFDYFSTLLLRGALSYNLNKKESVAIGYAHKRDKEYEDDVKKYSHENRLYEQYLYDFNAQRVELNVRFRLEQRFVKENTNVDFSQRVRAFVSAQIPLVTDSEFSKGLYTGIQNEAFFNVTNKDKVNNSLFDQNRSFISLGYRFGKKVDAEFGYMHWYQLKTVGSLKTNVWQFMLTTKF